MPLTAHQQVCEVVKLELRVYCTTKNIYQINHFKVGGLLAFSTLLCRVTATSH